MAFMSQSKIRDREYLQVLNETVTKVRADNNNKNNWKMTLQIMQQHFPNRKMSRESVRNSHRRLMNTNNVNNVVKRRDDKRMGRIELEDRLLAEVKVRRPMTLLMERLEASEDDIMLAVSRLQLRGFRAVSVFQENGILYIHNRVRTNSTVPLLSGDEQGTNIYDSADGNILTFAVVSDTHFGNVHTKKDELNKFYDEISERGVTTVLHAGDLVDGYYPNRPTSILEQYAHGFTEQLNDFVQDYPYKEGITTYFITGNHDHTFMRQGLANIGEVVEGLRDDMTYLGHNFGRVWVAPKVSVSLIHPTDGISQNFNKKIRDIIEKSPERRSDIMCIGHYHKVAMVEHRGVNGYVVPSFEGKTSFMQDMGIESIVGGMIFTVKTDKVTDEIISISTEIIKYE